MTPTAHENYAKGLLSSLLDDHPEIESLNFDPDWAPRGNAARAMRAILCHRLVKHSNHQPTRKGASTTYEWRDGIFNCRIIADRESLWTNMRRNLANKIHDTARSMPAAYLLAC